MTLAELTRTATVAVALTFGATSISTAQEAEPQKPQAQQKAEQQKPGQQQVQQRKAPKLHPASELTGMEVRDNAGKELGKLKEIVLNATQDKVEYGVIELADPTDAGDLAAVPWQAMKMKFQDRPNNVLVLDASGEHMAQAPRFDNEKWPEMKDESWWQKTLEFFNIEPDREEEQIQAEARRQGRANRRLSELVGLEVQTTAREDAGEVNQILVDTDRGDVVYGVLTLEDNRLVTIPWGVLDVTSDPKVVRIDATLDNIRQFAYQRGAPPNLEDDNYTRRLEESFGSERRVHGYVDEDGQQSVDKKEAREKREGEMKNNAPHKRDMKPEAQQKDQEKNRQDEQHQGEAL